MNRRDVLKRLGWGAAAVALARTQPVFGAAAPARKPNLLLILADDLGYSDLGCYGSEIPTPNLDALAANGLRFTQVYNVSRCCPSRASLLTGQYAHAVSFIAMSGSLPKTCVTIPEVLKSAGYRTYMSGKWHLGTPGPVQRGFEEYFGMLHGFGSFFDGSRFSRLPEGHPRRTYPKDGFYATDAITDHALDFIADGRASGKPWFLYLAYTAPHFPLHARKEDIARHKEVYAKGWDAIREERYARQKKLGVIDPAWPLTPRSTIPPNHVATEHGWSGKQNPAWDAIEPDRQADLARRMAIYAAMVDRMDRQIGRVVEDLRKNGDLDNTLILFLSDNGACAEWDPWGFDVDTGPKNILHKGAELDAMGGPGTYHSIGSGWANACNTPFRFYKHYSYEGGIGTPFIVHWPAGLKRRNEIDHRPAHVMDLLPTLADLAGATYPASVDGTAIMPTSGRSLVPAFSGAPDTPRTIYFEHEGSRGVREGKWKLVALANKPWELYDITADRVEMNNLASQHPERVAELSAKYDAWAKSWHRGDAPTRRRKPAGEA